MGGEEFLTLNGHPDYQEREIMQTGVQQPTAFSVISRVLMSVGKTAFVLCKAGGNITM